ncbi:MAG: DUF819 family protein [Firmicutes bacterium]|nr:DUF819 family protein [Bacillota bacterium]MCL5040728.1 DUF819 family protein [Bacillota bacterium]
MEIILIAVYFLSPAVILYLSFRLALLEKIGTILLCYLVGIVLGNSGLIPQSFSRLQSLLSEATVVVSLPLLLFSLDVKQWFKIAGKAMLSMFFAVISIVIVAFILFFAIRQGRSHDAWQLAGMAMAVYTGGTPNLVAVKMALNVDSNTYILFHTYDTIISAIYMFFVISIAQRLFNRYLPPFRSKISVDLFDENSGQTESLKEYRGLFNAGVMAGLAVALLLSLMIVGVSLFISGFVPESYSTAVTILLITFLAIVFSFAPRIRKIERTFPLGMYLIYVFSVVVASMSNLEKLIKIDSSILLFVAGSIFGSMFLHAIFSRMAGIDTDTFLVTSVSAICSPPFVPLVTAALKNRAVLLSGLTTGIVGYAIGNFLGISLAYLFKAIP